MDRARTAVICNIGLKDIYPDGRDIRLGTPYGPTPLLRLVSVGKTDTVFLNRRGNRESRPLSNVNYRAIIWGLHELGVERIIGTDVAQSLTGSQPREWLASPSDMIDLTKTRESTFYDQAPVVRINPKNPFCPEIRSKIISSCRSEGIEPESNVVYVCIDGPRFRTAAEMKAIAMLGGDIVGMSLAPEAFLARELGICYAAITVVSGGEEEDFIPNLSIRLLEAARSRSEILKEILIMTIKEIPVRRECSCARALEGTLI